MINVTITFLYGMWKNSGILLQQQLSSFSEKAKGDECLREKYYSKSLHIYIVCVLVFVEN